jgi:3-oxoacyl-[acyl-carrier-protein] synthase II
LIFHRAAQKQHRVVVTGVGAVTPLGLTAEASWQQMLAGKSGISKITRFDATGFDSQIAGEVKNFSCDDLIPKKEQKKIDLFTQYALSCTQMALSQGQLTINESNRHRGGTIVGVGIGGLSTIEEQFLKMKEKGPGRISPFFIPQVISNMAAGQVSIFFHLQGPNFSTTSACASGAHAIGEAANHIRNGTVDFMLAGGAESTVCASAMGGFAAMRALSNRNDAPEKASRPFDKDRDGFVLSEGAAILLLESYEHAHNRGAKILCELTGYGLSADAHHMTSPAPEGEGAQRAMRMALRDAGINPSQVNYINAHGTSTPVGDEMESLAIKKVFGDSAKKIIVNSTKSMIGHTLGAAGAIESFICVQALVDQISPPTINLENPSEGCDLDYCREGARKANIQYAMNNSFGFGGTNACLVFGKL